MTRYPSLRNYTAETIKWHNLYWAEYAAAAHKTGVLVLVSQAPDKHPIPTEVMAQDIAEIAAAMKNINAGRLNQKALLVILAHASGLSQKNVKSVLAAMDGLEKMYLKPKK